MKAIRSSDALLGFTTRRESIGEGQYRTHDWVVLVKIAHALRRLHEMTEVITVRLGPPGAVDEVSVLLDDPSFVCTWQMADLPPRRHRLAYGRRSLDGGTIPLIRKNATMFPYISLSCWRLKLSTPSLVISRPNIFTLVAALASVMEL